MNKAAVGGRKRRPLWPGRGRGIYSVLFWGLFLRDLQHGGNVRRIEERVDDDKSETGRQYAACSRFEAGRKREMEEIGEWSVMAKTLSTDNYLQISQLMQAPVARRWIAIHLCQWKIVWCAVIYTNGYYFETDYFLLCSAALLLHNSM